MAQNPEKKFRAQVQETVKALKARGGREPHATTDDRGVTVLGWRFELAKNWTSDPQYNWDNGHGGFEETRGEDWVILTVDGKFYYHAQYHENKRAGRGEPYEEQSVNRLRELGLSYFVGSQGEPFSKAIAELKRFSYY